MRFSRTVRSGSRLSVCGATPIDCFIFLRLCEMSCPNTSILPSSGITRPRIILMVVVLPAPLGPKRAMHFPSSTIRLKESMTVRWLKAFLSPLASITGIFVCISSFLVQHLLLPPDWWVRRGRALRCRMRSRGPLRCELWGG